MLLSTTTALVRAAVRRAAAVPVLGDRREPLGGRVLFITGAARGLGAELARQAHTEGARVALVRRRLEPLQASAAELGDLKFPTSGGSIEGCVAHGVIAR